MCFFIPGVYPVIIAAFNSTSLRSQGSSTSKWWRWLKTSSIPSPPQGTLPGGECFLRSGLERSISTFSTIQRKNCLAWYVLVCILSVLHYATALLQAVSSGLDRNQGWYHSFSRVFEHCSVCDSTNQGTTAASEWR